MEEDIETCGWFVFYKDQLLIEKKNGMYTIPFGTEPPCLFRWEALSTPSER